MKQNIKQRGTEVRKILFAFKSYLKL